MICTLAGQRVEFGPDRAAFWHEASTLIVADLHWGKDTSFRRAGAAVPEGSLGRDLARLGSLVERHRAERILVAGDLIHARSGMADDVIERVRSWRRSLQIEMLVVPGNHDRSLHRFAGELGVELTEPEHREGPFVFAHEPVRLPDSFVWSGHIHPCVRVPGGGRAPCFHICENEDRSGLCVLPAFGGFTGGVRYEPPGFDRHRVLAIAEDRIVEFKMDRASRSRPGAPAR